VYVVRVSRLAPRSVLIGFVLMWLVHGCISTRLVNFDNLAVHIPPADPAQDWQRAAHALLERYEATPVLAPEDERLEPLFGGLTTLSYFGADAEPRVLDQQLPAHDPALGSSLSEACGEELGAASVRTLATTGLPAFAPVWLPLSLTQTEQIPAAVSCDAHGKPVGPGAAASFCLFGRLALQSETQRPLIVVVHGMFDSGAQAYVQRLAAVLYGLGHSVLVPDMRDHGETLRAAPHVATTLGALEGQDLLTLAAATRQACGARIGRVGIAGVSGGGLAAIRAFTLDQTRAAAAQTLDAGVVALSPMLDVNAVIRDLSDTGTCAATRSIELNWLDDVAIGAAAGATFFGGAATVAALNGERLDGNTALTAAIGAGAGLLSALALDAWFDGGTQPCVAEHAIAHIVADMLRVRWQALRRFGGLAMSPAGQRLDDKAIGFDSYLHERVQYLAAEQGIAGRRFDAPTLASELRRALQTHAAAAEHERAHLLVLGAEDDPMTRSPALHEFAARTGGLSQVYTAVVTHGGHGAMWVVQPVVMRALLARFFGDPGAR
jgi:predicted alpha/beta-fold hydrolase